MKTKDKKLSAYQKRTAEIEWLKKDLDYLEGLLKGLVEAEYSSDRQDYINEAAEYYGYVSCHLCNAWVKGCGHACPDCGWLSGATDSITCDCPRCGDCGQVSKDCECGDDIISTSLTAEGA